MKQIILKSIILVLLIALMTTSNTLLAEPSFAAEKSGALSDYTEESEDTEEIQTPVVHPRAITKAEVKRYKKYKGRNARKIPVLTYHRIVYSV